MTDQEIEKLRGKLGSDYSVKRLNGAVAVELADIWKGVEFVEYIGHPWPDTNQTVFKVISVGDKINVVDGSVEGGNFLKSNCKPSTEYTYVEQLKAKAHKLYGEIKNGDRFDLSMFGGFQCDIYLSEKRLFTYDKRDDSLSLAGFLFYKQGKWAKKIERVEVEGSWIHFDDTYLSIRFSFPKKAVAEPSTVSAHLAKCLEDYLNKIP